MAREIDSTGIELTRDCLTLWNMTTHLKRTRMRPKKDYGNPHTFDALSAVFRGIENGSCCSVKTLGSCTK